MGDIYHTKIPRYLFLGVFHDRMRMNSYITFCHERVHTYNTGTPDPQRKYQTHVLSRAPGRYNSSSRYMYSSTRKPTAHPISNYISLVCAAGTTEFGDQIVDVRFAFGNSSLMRTNNLRQKPNLARSYNYNGALRI